jgi:DNA invertase Pin-like site-specific DNA recombinase
LSASKRHVTRREFQKAVDAIIEHGHSKTFLVWKLDRFDRRGAGSVLTVVDELDRRKARLATYVENVDSATKGARTIIAIYAERAREEAEDIQTRVETGQRAHKAMGRRGTGRPPFGTISERGSGKVGHHPDEYPTARLLAEKLLSGKATRIVAFELNEEGHKTRGGHDWSATAVAKLAQSPLFAGMVPLRERNVDEYGNPLGTWKGYGEPMYTPDGEPLMCGQGVITPGEFFRIRAMVRERSNPFDRKGKRAGTYQSNGTARCGRCYGPLHGGGGKYHCSTRAQRGPSVCAGVATLAERLDGALETAWINHVSALEPDDDRLFDIGRELLDFADPESAARREHMKTTLEAAEARSQRLEDHYWNPPEGITPMPESTYLRQREGLARTIADGRKALAVVDRTADVSVLLDADHLRVAWEGADLLLRRRLLRAVFPNGVAVRGATRRGDSTPIHERLDFNPPTRVEFDRNQPVGRGYFEEHLGQPSVTA